MALNLPQVAGKALIFAGRAGTSLTAEIGLMRAGEQFAAMEMMGVDPMRRIIVPRFVGSVISMPILAIIFSVIGIVLTIFLAMLGFWFMSLDEFTLEQDSSSDFYSSVSVSAEGSGAALNAA